MAVVNKKRRWSMLAALTACSLVASVSGMVGQPAAWATASPSSGGDGVVTVGASMTVADILEANPRAREIRPNVVEIDKGLAILVPAPDGVKTMSAQYTDGRTACDAQWICMWENSFGQNLGYGLAFYSCQAAGDSYDLMSYRYPDGAVVGRGTGLRWNDRISSYANNQTSGTHSWFGNWVGNTLYNVRDSYAPDYSEDLASVNLNDVIDAVHSCNV